MSALPTLRVPPYAPPLIMAPFSGYSKDASNWKPEAYVEFMTFWQYGKEVVRKVLLYLFNSKCDCKSSISWVHQIEHPISEVPIRVAIEQIQSVCNEMHGAKINNNLQTTKGFGEKLAKKDSFFVYRVTHYCSNEIIS